MKNYSIITHFITFILIFSLFACSTEKKVENFTKTDMDNEISTEGSYMYIFVAKLSATNAELIQFNKDLSIMLNKIPGVLDISSGFQNSKNVRYNLGVTIRFQNKVFREGYSTNPHHKALREQYNSIVVEESSVVEFEVL